MDAHFDPAAAPARSTRWRYIVIGALCGLFWGAAFRAWMAEMAGFESRFDWYGTFVAIVGSGALVGALLGLAEYVRRTGGRPRWRWLALAPLVFAVVPLTMPGAVEALVTQGLGGGAIAIALTAVAGGFALSGRGPLWARILSGTLAALVAGAMVLTTGSVGGARLAIDEPRGAWAAMLGGVAVVVFCLAASIPFRSTTGAPVGAPAEVAATATHP
jgi:hypothetical protein